MRRQRLRVLVLLIDKDRVRVVLDMVGNIADSSRLLAGGRGQCVQGLHNSVAIFRGKLQPYGKADHQSGFLLASQC